ncbi:hypothetical protein MBAV_002918 [Candidatus Magnetobacterium bavaricum]|uniref:Methionine synthase n=1 Tax=Candidatus Magnetobacterium bavaricum TaxID=29290 RepID=A0A0F3GSI7_9BACT|nr:hypothetical protein MBAV_002918 [Candidatus Magnetobacterium bavaricum]
MSLRFATTGIGSLPHEDIRRACTLILDNCTIPFWPQFPKLAFEQGMVAQFTEGFPALRVDSQRERIWIDRQDVDAIARFYETCIDNASIPISPAWATGFGALEGFLTGRRLPVLKGHVTGPLTFTLGIKDNSGKYIYYDEELREIALMLLVAKARWQIQSLKRFADRVIVFIDEPMLSALGSSAYIGVSTEDASSLLRRMIQEIRGAGAMTAIHCCGNADWEMVFDTTVDIVNFDAYAYFDTLNLYHERIAQHISGGGFLAWGIVPTLTIDDIRREDFDSIAERFTERFERLAAEIGIEALAEHSLLTPSCGAGILDVEMAEKVFHILGRLRQYLIERFGG